MKIPLVDLSRQYFSLKSEIDRAVLAVLENGTYINGPALQIFEKNFADFCGVKHGVGLNSGTDALYLALKALGINEGDEVIVPAMTYIATAEAVSYCGAKPVFVDIDKDSYAINPLLIEEKITAKTKAIIPVHLYGTSARMDIILEIAKKHNLRVIEDCSEAHGALYHGKKVGSFGDVGCFSFYPTKNLGANGNGGMCLTDDEEIFTRIKLLANHGSWGALRHVEIGYNSRLDEIQSTILNLKLKHLDKWNNRRREIATQYDEAFAGEPLLKLPYKDTESENVYYLYLLQSPKRDLIIQKLNAAGIQTGIYFDPPVHLQKAYTFLKYQPGDFSVAETLAANNFSLPIFPELTSEEIDYIIRSLMVIIKSF